MSVFVEDEERTRFHLTGAMGPCGNGEESGILLPRRRTLTGRERLGRGIHSIFDTDQFELLRGLLYGATGARSKSSQTKKIASATPCPRTWYTTDRLRKSKPHLLAQLPALVALPWPKPIVVHERCRVRPRERCV